MKRRWLFVGASFLSLMVAAEIFGHLFFADPLAVSDLVIPTSAPLYFQGKPNVDLTYRGVLAKLRPSRIRLNSRGFRDVEPDPTDPRPRINIYGDSQAFGLGIPEESTLAYQLQARFPELRVNNYAVPGYNFRQMLGLFEKNPPDFALSMFVIFNNDFSPVIGITEKPPLFALARHSFWYQFYFLVRYVARVEDDEPAARRRPGVNATSTAQRLFLSS